MGRLIRELMTAEFDKVFEDEPIYEAVKRIVASRKTTIACVVDREDKLKGLLTPRDILVALVVREYGAARGRFFAGPAILHLLTSKYAGDIMSAPVNVHVSDAVEEAVNIMLNHGFYELPVVDEDMKVRGAISYFDIIMDALEDGKV